MKRFFLVILSVVVLVAAILVPCFCMYLFVVHPAVVVLTILGFGAVFVVWTIYDCISN